MFLSGRNDEQGSNKSQSLKGGLREHGMGLKIFPTFFNEITKQNELKFWKDPSEKIQIITAQESKMHNSYLRQQNAATVLGKSLKSKKAGHFCENYGLCSLSAC